MYHANVNVNSIVENVTRIKSGITINVGMKVKVWQNIMCAKKIWNPTTCTFKNGW